MTTPLRPLYELADIQSGLPVRSLASRDAGGGALVFALMPASLKNDAEISPNTETLVPALAEGNPEERHRVKPGDIFITAKSTEASMRCCLISHDWKPELSPCFASSLIRIQPTSQKTLLPQYLHAWLASPAGKAAMLAESQSATTQLNLTTSSISRVKVPIPPLSQQHKVVRLLDAALAVHDSALTAAKARLTLAQEIAFHSIDHE
jgi:restriction endonuclease S subunit